MHVINFDMDDINVSGVDLNLLRWLDLLLREQSVTRAAVRAGITQSSMSHALARLRRLFGDPLLVRAGRGVVLTPRAEALASPLRQALHGLAQVVRGEAGFSPASARRSFVIASPDLFGAILPRLLARLAHEAPGVRLELRPLPAGDVAGALAEGEIDLALCPPPCEGAGLVQRGLAALPWCILGRKGHPALRGKRGAASWVQYPHVVVRSGRATPNVVEEALRAAGLSRQVGLVVPGFLLALVAIAKSELLFTAPRPLVEPLLTSFGLSLAAPPIPIPSIRVLSVWHERSQADPGHRWLRQLFVDLLA